MKLFSFTTLVAGAGVAQVLASPLLVMVTTPANTPSNLRFGHAVPIAGTPEHPIQIKKVHHCGAHIHRFNQKAIEISNLFRQILGLPLIQSGHPGDAKIGIMPFIGTAPTFQVYNGTQPPPHHPPPHFPRPGHHGEHPKQPGHHGHHHHPGHHRDHRFGRGPFLARIHRSLMNLGPWEGRAVAFVLGCGIGVLLRMFFVLAVVVYRVIKGQRADEHEYSQITVIEDISPPTYAYSVDEKVAIPVEPVEIVKAPSTTEETK